MDKKTTTTAEMREHISSLFLNIEQTELDVQLIRTILNQLKNSITELELVSKRIKSDSEKSRSKINFLMEMIIQNAEREGLMDLEAKDKLSKSIQEKSEKQEKKIKTRQQKPAIQVESYAEALQNNQKKPGVIIFITPDTEDRKRASGDSTCIPRRQLLPTVEEEKMILDYMIRNNRKPTQKEYNQVLTLQVKLIRVFDVELWQFHNDVY